MPRHRERPMHCSKSCGSAVADPRTLLQYRLVLGLLRRPMSKPPLRPYRLGWYGDEGLGDRLIAAISAGIKTATAAPSYDPEEGKPGDLLALVDKTGKRHATLRVTVVELRLFADFDEALAAKLGAALSDIRAMTSFANSRPIGPEEEMRVTHFEVVK